MPYIRPEAQPVNWSTLDNSQQDAFRHIVQMLHECVDALPDKERSDGAWVYQGRSSRTAFLTGGRGTGKTSVYLSVRRSCEEPSILSKDSPNDLRQELTAMSSRLIWLEPLDMEVVTDSSNLLAAILCRISKVVKSAPLGARSNEDARRALLEPPHQFHDVISDLNRLINNVALSWDGNPKERRAIVDPDTFAQEITRTEESRLDLVVLLSKVLDGLALHAFRGSEWKNPLFVLPVDDFDLNPTACLGLLRLLRMISVPRLFTFVLGDVRVAEDTLRLRTIGDLAAVYGQPLALPDVPMEFEVQAHELATNAVRKLIPPGQRAILRPMSSEEALGFRPLGFEKEPALRELLNSLPIDLLKYDTMGKSPENLNEFLHCDRGSYVGNQMFGTTPRRVADLWIAMLRLTQSTRNGNDKRDDVIRLIYEHCESSLREDPSISSQLRKTVLDTLQPTQDEQWIWADLPFYVASNVSSAVSYDFETYGEHRLRFYFRYGNGWRFEVDPTSPVAVRTAAGSDIGRGRSMQRLGRSLAPESSGSLALLHDLIALGPSSRSLHARLIHWDVGDQWATVEWSRGDECKYEMRWSVPPANSFYELDHFMSSWREMVLRMDTTRGIERFLLEFAGYQWINAGTAMLLRQPPIAVESLPEPQHWLELSKRLELLVDWVGHFSTPIDKAASWLSDVAILTTPERGLGFIYFHELAKHSEKLRTYWLERAAPLVCKRRAIRLAEMTAKGLGGLVDRFLHAEPVSEFQPDAAEIARFVANYQPNTGTGPGTPGNAPTTKSKSASGARRSRAVKRK